MVCIELSFNYDQTLLPSVIRMIRRGRKKKQCPHGLVNKWKLMLSSCPYSTRSHCFTKPFSYCDFNFIFHLVSVSIFLVNLNAGCWLPGWLNTNIERCWFWFFCRSCGVNFDISINEDSQIIKKKAWTVTAFVFWFQFDIANHIDTANICKRIHLFTPLLSSSSFVSNWIHATIRQNLH